jgi:hypothetical protein
VEKAVLVHSRDRTADDAALDRLFPGPGGTGAFDRLHFGCETCEHALPSPSRLASVVALCRSRAVPLTLVTPVCTTEGVARVRALVAVLDAGSEVVFNDWGCLAAIRDSGVTPVHGRLLNRGPRDPRLRPGDLEPDALAFVRTTVLHDPAYHDFLRERGVARVELDDVAYGYLPPPEGHVAASLVAPYVHIATSRYCGGAFASRCTGDCPALETDARGAPLFVWGTAAFHVPPPHDPAVLSWRFDRLVRQVGPLGLADFVASGLQDRWQARFR